MSIEIDPIAIALYNEHSEVISGWIDGADPFKKAVAQTILKAAGIEQETRQKEERVPSEKYECWGVRND